MIDDRIHQHLHADADRIDLPVGDVGSIVGRADRRRRNRRGALSVVVAAALVTSGVTVFNGSGDETLLAGQDGPAGTVVESTLDWTGVAPRTGLGYAQAMASTDDGAVYSLSTAPGRPSDDGDSGPATLYRSADGTEWEELALPEAFRAGSLAAAGNQLYAVGTAPESGGGGAEVTIARTTDAGANWVVDNVPLGLEHLRERHPGQLVVGTAKVAHGAAGPVGVVEVRAEPDVDALLPAGVDPDDTSSYYTSDGVVVESRVGDDAMEIDVPPPVEADDRPVATSTTTTVPDADGFVGMPPTTVSPSDAPVGTPPTAVPASDAPVGPTPLLTLTWDELGLDPDLQDIAASGGRLYTFAIGDDGVEAAELETDGRLAGRATVVADADGYVVVFPEETDDANAAQEVEVRRSTDGLSWTPVAGPAERGYLVQTGVLDGRLSIALEEIGATGVRIHTADGLGGWRTVDPVDATSGGAEASVVDVAFGPLGLAVVVFESGDTDDSTTTLVHSTDGVALSAVGVADHVEEPFRSPVGLVVTADAVVLRMAEGPGDDQASLPAQRLLVGVPRG